MSKRTNTVLFLLVASLVNVVLTIIILFVLFLAAARLFPSLLTGASTGVPTLIAIIILSLVASAFAYRGLIALFRKKVDMEKHFDPLFGAKQRSRRSE